VVLDRLQRGQIVDIKHLGADLANEEPARRRADKSGAAGEHHWDTLT
jgi:hypothetical protein